jgi:hypothetical protein
VAFGRQRNETGVGPVFGSKKKLYAEGAQTEGVVIKASAVVNPLTVNPGYGVVVRAKFPDGSTAEFTQGHLPSGGYMYPESVGTPFVGQVVPVRYDPSDHSKVAIDLPALEERHQQATAQATAAQQAELDAQVAHLGDPGAQSTGEPAAQPPIGQQASDPVDRLSRLAELKQQGVLTEEEFTVMKAKILGES